MTIVLVRPILSDIAHPPKRDAKMVFRRIDETTRPCIVDERALKVAAKGGVAAY